MREIPGIPYRFHDPALLALALSHRSTGRDNNERLEFLGDSILNFVVAARLFDVRSGDDEGDLSRLRARVVRGETLARLATELKLGDYIRLGEGELFWIEVVAGDRRIGGNCHYDCGQPDSI